MTTTPPPTDERVKEIRERHERDEKKQRRGGFASYCDPECWGRCDTCPDEHRDELHKDRAYLLRALSDSLAREREAVWRDIESAPKDGYYLITNTKRQVCPCEAQDGQRLVLNNLRFAPWDFGEKATAWQPLPEPPAIRSPSERT